MKKSLILMVLALIVMMPVWGQSDDVVVRGSNDLRYEHEVPLAGSKVVNTISGRRVYDGNFSTFFLEGAILVNDYHYRVGMGCTFAYVPGRWGCYGTMVSDPYGYRNYGATPRVNMGAVVRPFLQSPIDWQLYGGLSIGRTAGVDFGIRVAPNNNGSGGNFCWWSGSMGRLYTTDGSYTMIGVSIDITLVLMTVIIF